MPWNLAVLAAVLLVACGGRTRLYDSDQELTPLGPSDGGVECVENGECAENAICLENACVFFGECLRDFHCYTTGGCVENQCVGDVPPVVGEDVLISCQINADCPNRHYCVSDSCRLGVECLSHAHCDPGKACVGRLCVDAI